MLQDTGDRMRISNVSNWSPRRENGMKGKEAIVERLWLTLFQNR